MKVKKLVIFIAGAATATNTITAQIATNTLSTSVFWLSTNTHSLNLGTFENPYICATGPEFDSVMSRMPPNCTVHIPSGIYYTLGSPWGYSLKSGQRIMGSGMDATIIRLANNTAANAYVMYGPCNSLGTNIEVSDLTLDCNYTGAITNAEYQGLSLNGTRMAERRVKVINLTMTPAGETWGIGINAFAGGNADNSDGNLIEDCEVSNLLSGTACSAIFLNAIPHTNPGCSISGIIKNNRIFLTPTNSQVAINGSWEHDTVIEGNYVNGAATGFYEDTGGQTNVVVTHNTFLNVLYGVFYNGGPAKKNVTFADNKISISPCNGIGFFLAPNSSTTNISILGNTVDLSGPPVGGYSPQFLHAVNIVGLFVTNNTINPGLTNPVSGVNLLIPPRVNFQKLSH